MNVGGKMFPLEGEEPRLVTSEDPAKLMAALEDYLVSVLTLLEPLAPSD